VNYGVKVLLSIVPWHLRDIVDDRLAPIGNGFMIATGVS